MTDLTTDLTQYPDYIRWLEERGYLDGYKIKIKAKIFGINGILYDVDTVGYMQRNPEVDENNQVCVAFLTGYGPTTQNNFNLCGSRINIAKLLANVISYPKEILN